MGDFPASRWLFGASQLLENGADQFKPDVYLMTAEGDRGKRDTIIRGDYYGSAVDLRRNYGTNLMRPLLAISFAIFSCAQFESSAGAERCPVTGGDARRAMIARAPSCQNAVQLFKRCATSASVDGRLALSVMKVCENSSLARMSAKERVSYEAAIGACNKPYVLKRGTIYRSMAAHCRVDVIAGYDRRH